jgi:hypothetical protein
MIGLIFGIAQIFFVREKTMQNVEKIEQGGEVSCLAISPECGECPAESRDGYCYYPPYSQKFRGFPLTSGSYGYDSRTDISAAVMFNVAILAFALPMIGLLVMKLRQHIQRR